MSEDLSFGYALSTLEGRLLNNLELIKQLNAAKDPVVIINQCQKNPIDSSIFGDHVTVLNTPTIGVSISRNLAIRHSKSDFVMICDDDILLIPESIGQVKSAILKDQSVALFWTPLRKTTGQPWRRDYDDSPFDISGLTFKSKRKIQGINSMEQIVNVNYFKDKKLAYNESFGLGSSVYELGEETLLSWGILNTGGIIRYLPFSCRTHPPISSGSSIKLEDLKAIHAVHRIVFWPIGSLVFLGFSLKILLKSLVSLAKANRQS